MKALLVGASGVMGRATTALLRRGVPFQLTLAARRREPVEEMSRVWSRGDARVEHASVDVTAPGLAEVFAGFGIVISCAGPASETESAARRAAIAAGVPYVSLCDEHDAFVEATRDDRSARETGVAVIAGCGLTAGITNLLYVVAAADLDEIHDAMISVAGSLSDGMGPAAVRRLQAEPGDSPRPVYFPEPVGWVETFRRAHPEVAAFDVPLESRSGLTEKAAMDVVRLSAMAGRGLSSPARPLVAAARFLPPRGPAWSAARVEVRGARRGGPAAVILGVVDRLANLAPGLLVQGAVALAEGKVKPGVHAAHEALDARGALSALARSGVRIARLEPEHL